VREFSDSENGAGFREQVLDGMAPRGHAPISLQLLGHSAD
jgi:hypothetical protein